MNTKKNIFYAQSGGATAVINASACGVIEAAREHSEQIGTVFAGRNGIIGALNEELIDTQFESAETIAGLKHTPACAFGSCRYKLKDPAVDDSEYRQLIEVFKAHDIGYFFYNGGNDSQDTANKVAYTSEKLGYPMQCIGIPKTIDNDLPFTDHCPGFGSVAKYVAISTRETGMDLRSMSASSTKVFILEVMGRHAGWIASAAGLAANETGDAPHIILFPEIAFDKAQFLQRVKDTVNQFDHCVIVVSEGVKDNNGCFLTESSQTTDAFGHQQLGGVAPILSGLITQELGLKTHWAVADYLQRAARHIASQTDVDEAYALGRSAVEFALQGQSGVMLTIERDLASPYQWHVGTVPLADVANVEFTMPREFISEDGMHITEACRDYLAPLVLGEAYPPYDGGLPVYVSIKGVLAGKKLLSEPA